MVLRVETFEIKGVASCIYVKVKILEKEELLYVRCKCPKIIIRTFYPNHESKYQIREFHRNKDYQIKREPGYAPWNVARM